MSKKLYHPLKQVTNISEFESARLSGWYWFSWNGKTTHISVLISLQYRVLESIISSGRLWFAVKGGETNDKKTADEAGAD